MQWFTTKQLISGRRDGECDDDMRGDQIENTIDLLLLNVHVHI